MSQFTVWLMQFPFQFQNWSFCSPRWNLSTFFTIMESIKVSVLHYEKHIFLWLMWSAPRFQLQGSLYNKNPCCKCSFVFWHMLVSFQGICMLAFTCTFSVWFSLRLNFVQYFWWNFLGILSSSYRRMHRVGGKAIKLAEERVIVHTVHVPEISVDKDIHFA